MGQFSSILQRSGFATVYMPASTPLSALTSRNSPTDQELTSGTGNSQCDLEYRAQRTLSASANEDLDLAGSLADVFGATLTFVKVRGIWIKAAAGNTNSVVIKPASSNGFTGPFGAATHTITLPPSGVFLVTAPVGGWTVTAGTVDKINIANSAGSTSVTYDIHVIGASA
ncbi:hypothetical protein [Taklimakanibacter deserti]|uniref:hypothetical protein n=1 Tax=Taklimakanibacter deserti TaxID=2267839 RepID=UPI000E6565A4